MFRNLQIGCAGAGQFVGQQLRRDIQTGGLFLHKPVLPAGTNYEQAGSHKLIIPHICATIWSGYDAADCGVQPHSHSQQTYHTTVLIDKLFLRGAWLSHLAICENMSAKQSLVQSYSICYLQKMADAIIHDMIVAITHSRSPLSP